MSSTTTYHDVSVPNGVKVHYIEAGAPSKPTLLLLHGFPTSSKQYKPLISLLADSYHIYAPDLPGFGLTTVPENYKHSFANNAREIGAFLDALKIDSFAVYIFDYGAPTLFRLALERPKAIKAIISQNGNAYEEGLGADFWAPLQQWWASGKGDDKATRDMVAGAVLNVNHFKDEYTIGVPENKVALIDPTNYTTDYLLNASTDKQKQVQLNIFFDYGTNVTLYPKFQAYLREHQPPLLAVWGKGDICFIPPGAEAFKRDVKDAKVVLLDTGHFAMETDVDEIAKLIKEFLAGVKL